MWKSTPDLWTNYQNIHGKNEEKNGKTIKSTTAELCKTNKIDENQCRIEQKQLQNDLNALKHKLYQISDDVNELYVKKNNRSAHAWTS